MTVTNNIYQKQIKYHVFNAVTNSELTELVPVFTIRPAFPTSVKKVNTSFKNVWRTWGPALPTSLADLMIFCPLGPMNFKNPDICSMCVKNNNQVGKQEVGIWWVQKRFPRYGVPIWSLWPNIRFLPSIVAEKNVTKNVHICSMCIKIKSANRK